MINETNNREERERAISQRYDRMANRLIQGGLLTVGLGIATLSFVVMGSVNSSRNPYRDLPTVVEYVDVQQGLRDVEESRFSLEKIAERNPNLIESSEISSYVDKRRDKLTNLESHPDYIAYQNWNQEKVYSYLKYAGLSLGGGFGVALLLCFGISKAERKRNRELKKLEGER